MERLGLCGHLSNDRLCNFSCFQLQVNFESHLHTPKRYTLNVEVQWVCLSFFSEL